MWAFDGTGLARGPPGGLTVACSTPAAVALRAESERAVLDSVLVGIVTVGPEGIEWMNRSARRMFGCELEDVQGQPMGVLAPEDEAHAFHTEPGAEVFECQLRGRDGQEVLHDDLAVLFKRHGERSGPQARLGDHLGVRILRIA